MNGTWKRLRLATMRNGCGRYANSAGVSMRLAWFATYT